ncbi:MAG: GTPase ObgE, partial [Thermoanaerobaculia bacterium]
AHLVDLAAEGPAVGDLAVVERELAAFDPVLLERPRLLVGSKLDAARPQRRAELAAAGGERGLPYLEVSAATGEGVRALVAALARQVAGGAEAA